ncbi:hypothetical protein [Demequina oxidasica]|uniref:hypothetical protein n=1 Tax=Demequina oxidasica TaxID=676199 RepID=UPI001F2494DD|nr:hypothetical protein [Demequina oxidasica]
MFELPGTLRFVEVCVCQYPGTFLAHQKSYYLELGTYGWASWRPAHGAIDFAGEAGKNRDEASFGGAMVASLTGAAPIARAARTALACSCHFSSFSCNYAAIAA